MAEIYAGGAARMFTLNQKTAEGPDVAGDFTGEARGVSVYNWFETHPAGRMAVAASAFGAMGWLAARMARTRS